MALHPSFPQSPYAELIPDQRWFPADEDFMRFINVTVPPDIRPSLFA